MPVIPQLGLGRSETELKVNRRNTEAFIDAALSLVTLIPQTRLKSGSGTKMVPGVPRPAQKARLVDQTRTFGAMPGQLTGADSTERQIQYQLVLLWDAVIGVDDYWVDSAGFRWNVVDLLPDNGYERRAEVKRYGEG